uniref:Uncharacterized protein n=1 Tax=Peronospora matthiolae TaxID=2874970 RepID=A0AAV1USJ4_9STRA
MSSKALATQFKWYLHDYASNASDRDASVTDNCWGGSEILRMAANFLRPDIYVIERRDGDDSE